VPDGDGGFTHTYAPLVPPTWWVEIKPATARDLERIGSGTVLSTATHLVTGRYRSDVTTQTRLTFHERVFSVTGRMNPGERNRELVLVCVEVVP
jgi:SPP1 family predicted phage head-tail adaptor